MSEKQRPSYHELVDEIDKTEAKQRECAERTRELKRRVDELNRMLGRAHEEYDRAAATNRKRDFRLWARRIGRREEALRAARAELRAARRKCDELDDRLSQLLVQKLSALFEMMSPEQKKEAKARIKAEFGGRS